MHLSGRIPLVAFSKTKCNTFCCKVPPAKIYQHLATQERTVVTTMRDDLCSIRTIAQRLCCSGSTIGCEIAEGRSWTCRAFVFALPRLRTASSSVNGRAT
ncbi:helix-turn-helix domain-containing protein [Janthinobacterium sp. GB4P2]|uniref:helix-turn-helix domain-containing protein n=1 Tax=Janthinobacterium sp. GB4P2 TaxID=3424189 RepID=UPI003F22A2F6